MFLVCCYPLQYIMNLNLFIVLVLYFTKLLNLPCRIIQNKSLAILFYVVKYSNYFAFAFFSLDIIRSANEESDGTTSGFVKRKAR